MGKRKQTKKVITHKIVKKSLKRVREGNVDVDGVENIESSDDETTLPPKKIQRKSTRSGVSPAVVAPAENVTSDSEADETKKDKNPTVTLTDDQEIEKLQAIKEHPQLWSGERQYAHLTKKEKNPTWTELGKSIDLNCKFIYFYSFLELFE